ncbi:hypothetical protein J7M00_07985 [bacterium]|nr:hypothetical protein [bacterium]
MKKYFFLAITILMLSAGCSKEENNPPQIGQITVNPECIAVGDVVTVSCSAYDQDGDVLTYQWSSADWSSEKTGEQITFVPDEPGDIEIFVSVSDGEATTESGAININVHPQHPRLTIALNDDDDVNCDIFLYHSGDLLASSTNAGNSDSIDIDVDHDSDYELRVICESGTGLYSITVSGDFEEAGYGGTLSESGDSIDVFFINDCYGLSKIN